MRSVLLVFDYTAKSGLGHLRRMAALAAALARRGTSTTPVLTTGEHFPETGVEAMHAAPLSLQDAVPARRDYDACVIDSYLLDADARGRLAPYLAVDDLVAPRNGAVLLVNPAFSVDPADYPNMSPEQLMLGPRYALIDPGLDGSRMRPPRFPPQSVFISLGSAGDEPAVSQIGREVAERTGLKTYSAGESASGFATGLSNEIGGADIVVSAGGVTALEAASAGRPLAVIELAENQRANAEGLVAAGCALRASREDAAEKVAEIAGDEMRFRSMAAAGSTTVDGRGAERVADALLKRTDRGSLEVPTA